MDTMDEEKHTKNTDKQGYFCIQIFWHSCCQSSSLKLTIRHFFDYNYGNLSRGKGFWKIIQFLKKDLLKEI